MLFPIKYSLKKIMSCPSCGAQIEILNQRFCQDCGGELPDFSKSSALAQVSSVLPEDHKLHQLQLNSVKIPGSRPLSKKSLGFGIVSLILAVTTFNFGSSLVTEPTIFNFLSRQNVFISLGIANLVGIAFGIASRIFNKQAKRSEPLNKAMRAGSTLGVIGLTFNLILMITAFSLAAISVT